MNPNDPVPGGQQPSMNPNIPNANQQQPIAAPAPTPQPLQPQPAQLFQPQPQPQPQVFAQQQANPMPSQQPVQQPMTQQYNMQPNMVNVGGSKKPLIKKLIIGLVAIVLIGAISGGVMMFINANKYKEQKQIAVDYITALENDDLEKAVQYWPDEGKKVVDQLGTMATKYGENKKDIYAIIIKSEKEDLPNSKDIKAKSAVGVNGKNSKCVFILLNVGGEDVTIAEAYYGDTAKIISAPKKGDLLKDANGDSCDLVVKTFDEEMKSTKEALQQTEDLLNTYSKQGQIPKGFLKNAFSL